MNESATPSYRPSAPLVGGTDLAGSNGGSTACPERQSKPHMPPHQFAWVVPTLAWSIQSAGVPVGTSLMRREAHDKVK
jgi:hypothetical protein